MLKYLGIFIAASGVIGTIGVLVFGHAGVWKDAYLYGTLGGQVAVGTTMYYLDRKADLVAEGTKRLRRVGWAVFISYGLIGIYIWESGVGTNI